MSVLVVDGRRRESLGVESLGARLKREREKQNLSLEDVAAATKIGTRMLKALENDQFDRLPGGIFNKGFVRAYATHLGLNGDQAVADYLAAVGGSPPPKPPEVMLAELATRAAEVRRREKRKSTKEIPWGRLAILLLLVALGFTIWGSYSRKETVPPAPDADRPAATENPAAGAPQSPPSTAKQVATRSNPELPPSSPPSHPAAQNQTSAPVPAPGFSVLIQAREDSWLLVVADGREVLHDLLPAHTERSFSATRKLMIKAGNVGGLDFSFNGKKLPAQGRSQEVKVLTFDSHGLRVPTAGIHQTSAPIPSQP
jgi:cytoskeleton protein RodZ